MGTQEQLKNLYETQLKPELVSMEKQRKIVAWLYRISIAFYVCTGLSFIFVAVQADSLEKVEFKHPNLDKKLGFNSLSI